METFICDEVGSEAVGVPLKKRLAPRGNQGCYARREASHRVTWAGWDLSWLGCVGRFATFDSGARYGCVSPLAARGESVNAEAGSARAEAVVVVKANSAGSIAGARPTWKETRLAGFRVDWTAIPTGEHAATAAGWSWNSHWLHAPQVMVDRVPPQRRLAGPCVAVTSLS